MSKKLKRFIPNKYKESVYEIDFFALYEQGFRLAFIDIDNTLANYKTELPTKENLELVDEIQKIGFEVILISNNYFKRVSKFSEPFGVPFVHWALKPLKRGYKKGLKKASREYKKEEVITVGDQLITDVKGSSKMGFYSILVKPIEKKTDVFTTKINRLREQRILKKIKKKYPKKYKDRLEKYESL